MSSVFSEDGQLFKDKVLEEVFRLKVRKASKEIVDIDGLEKLAIPQGVLADDPLPPESPELIPGILLSYGATGIIGQKETGKSLISLEIQHSLLTGEPLWGSIKPAKVLDKTVHFLAEHASPVLMGLYQRTGMSATGKLRIFGPEHLQGNKLIVSNGTRREEAISFYKKLAAGAGLVVFDPLAAFIQGQSAENDNAPMRSLVDAMIEIGTSTGAACLILGHQGKPTYFQGKQIKRTSYATRGASGSEDAMSAVHYLDKATGVTIDGKSLYELVPTHFKGYKQSKFNLLRDPKTLRHTLK